MSVPRKINALCCGVVHSSCCCMPTKRFLPRTQQCMKITYGKTPEIEFSICGMCSATSKRDVTHTYSASWYHEGEEYNKDICQKRTEKSDTHTDWIFQNGVVTQFYEFFCHDSIFHALLTRLWSRCENFQGAAFQWLKAYFFLTVKTVLIACQLSLYPLPQIILFRSVSGILKYQLISTYTMKRS